MKLFQESQTLEGFERNLNDENSRINNLDLNGDNFIDYIKVIDYVDRDVHNIVLQVAINKRENQDVAVFTVQRFSNGQVQIQLIGDEALYGRNYIIEPIYDEQYANQTPNPGYTGNVAVVRTTYYEIAAWPVIQVYLHAQLCCMALCLVLGLLAHHTGIHGDHITGTSTTVIITTGITIITVTTITVTITAIPTGTTSITATDVHILLMSAKG